MTSPSTVGDVTKAVAALDVEATANAVRRALDSGVQPDEIVDERGEIHLPELLMAEQCMRSGLQVIETFGGTESATLANTARMRLAERAATWMPELSSCVTRLLHSSDSFLRVK